MKESVLDKIHQLTVQGKIRLSRDHLERYLAKKPARSEYFRLAGLMRRLNYSERAVKWLHSAVRGTARQPADATAGEIAEYAVNLNRIGAQDEASNLLADLEGFDQIELYRSFLESTRWNYPKRAEHLENYLSSPAARGYDQLVAKVNLVDTLVYLREHKRIRPLLSALLHDTSVSKFYLLHANLLQVAGMDCLFRKDFEKADKFFAESGERLKSTDIFDEIYTQKSIAISKLFQSPEDSQARKEVLSVQKNAEQKGHWETVRDCDRFLAILCKDEEKFRHLFAGTPFEPFRKRLLTDYQEKVSVPESYEWKFGKGSAVQLDLRLGTLNGKPLSELLSRFLKSLFRDFYRPARVPSLFHDLYPNEVFHPDNSSLRVHQALTRLRKHLEGHDVEIVQTQGNYRFKSEHASVLVGLPTAKVLPLMLSRLKKVFPQSEFSTAEAAKVLKLSQRSVQRHLNSGKSDGFLERTGSSRAIRYRFK